MCKWYKLNEFKDTRAAMPVHERRFLQPEKYSEAATELALDPLYNDEAWQSDEWFGQDFDVSAEGVWALVRELD